MKPFGNTSPSSPFPINDPFIFFKHPVPNTLVIFAHRLRWTKHPCKVQGLLLPHLLLHCISFSIKVA